MSFPRRAAATSTKTRFARFYNLPELMAICSRLVADIQTADMLKLPVPKANYHVAAVASPSELQKEMVSGACPTRADSGAKQARWTPRRTICCIITNDGRKLALDQRLMNPMLPDDEHSKTAACAKNVYDIWGENRSRSGAPSIGVLRFEHPTF